MKKLIQINPVIRQTTSTGRIMLEIADLAMCDGWDCYVAYSGGRDGHHVCAPATVPVGGKLSVVWHGILTRLFDRHGLGSKVATRRFVRKLKEIDPDVIHIHNIHGYFLNYQILFRYLSTCGKPVVWTVHDCWLFTGHCYHYDSVGCEKWKEGCNHCPQKTAFPSSYIVDRSKQNYRDKRQAFLSVPASKFHVVVVSDWMKREMATSFLKDCTFHTIHNGIDTEVFHPYSGSSFREPGKYLLLGVASIWSKEKGLDDFVEIASKLKDNETLLLVGISEALAKKMPKNIRVLPRTADVKQLAEIYSAADVFLNLTYQDNYPTVNMEAMACGTPVVTYDTGGSVETIAADTGFVVPKGNIDAVLNAVREVEKADRNLMRTRCREHASSRFSRDACYHQYIDLYNQLLGE